jgi:peptide chain release factor subunit 1
MSDVASAELYEFRRKIRKLSEYRGTGTQLVSVYIPSGYPIPEITSKLREEVNQASNIKSKTTRTNVTSALEKIINYLKHFRKTPKNGMAIFCGNISQNPSKVDIQLFAVEPPYELKMSIYRCDSSFFLEPLQRMLEAKDSYGIVVLDGREATIALLKGTDVQIVKKLHSTAHAKIRKGGQSARRYERLINESIEKYYKRVGEAMDEAFLGKVKGVIVGGPGPTKDFFLKEKPFNYQIKILGVVDTGYTDEYGVREVVEKSEEILEGQEAIKEKRLIDAFMREVAHDGLITYGEEEVINAIKTKQAEHVLVSEGLEKVVYIMKCPSCGAVKKVQNAEGVICDNCGNEMIVEEEAPFVEEIIEMCHENGIKVDVISTNTAQGVQFLEGFGGLAAFLRYKL